MKYVKQFILVSAVVGGIFFAHLLGAVSYTPEEGKAEGQLIVNGEASKLQHVYALAQPGFFDKTKEDILVIVTNIPLSDGAVEDWAERNRMESEGTLHCVEMTVNAEKKPISVKIRHNAFEASPSGLSTDDVFEQVTFDESTIEGKMYTKNPREFFGTTYTYEATFKAAIRRKKEASPPSAADKDAAAGSPQAAVYRAYEKAVQSGEIEALKKVVSAEAAEQLSGPDAEEMMGFMTLFLPKNVEFLKVTVEGESVVLNVSGELDGERVEGSIEFVLEEGQWKVAGSSW